jgi:hypothetical protein
MTSLTAGRDGRGSAAARGRIATEYLILLAEYLMFPQAASRGFAADCRFGLVLENGVADIFHEVDEEVRREQLKRLWERYSILIIAVVVLIVAGVGGWRGYEWWQNKKAAAAGAQFEQAVTLSEAGKHAQAEAAFAKVAAAAPGGYRVLARLRAAAELAQTKPTDAVKAYDAITADPSVGETMQDLAAVRAGMLLVDTAPLAEMQRRLEPLTGPTRTFRHTARELLALSAWRNHDFAAARKYIDMITTDAESPPGTRARAEVLAALIAADGGKS